jgi:hypothetical protein
MAAALVEHRHGSPSMKNEQFTGFQAKVAINNIKSWSVTNGHWSIIRGQREF